MVYMSGVIMELYHSSVWPFRVHITTILLKSKHKRFITSQPNRKSKEWPAGYTGDKNAAGNRFSLECEIAGNVVYFVHMHMMSGTPMAINPRTKRGSLQ